MNHNEYENMNTSDQYTNEDTNTETTNQQIEDSQTIQTVEQSNTEDQPTKVDQPSHTVNPQPEVYQPVQLVQEVETKPEQPATRSKTKKNPKFKSFLSMLTAGVMGSVLTLTAVTQVDEVEGLFSKVGGTTQQAETNTAEPVTVQPVKAADSPIADIVERASKAIVGISNIQQQQSYFSSPQSIQKGTGTGVIFQKNAEYAYVVTNNHVIEGAQKIEVSLYNGEKVPGELVGADALTDLAVLKIDSAHVDTVLEFGDSSNLRPGEQVLAIGNPLGLDLSRTVTQGIVSATNRSIKVTTSAGEWELNVIQTDAAINPGNSGGALINTQGQVMGINSLKISNNGVEGLGFAIPSNDVVPIVNEIIKKGAVERPYIGIGLVNLADIPEMYRKDLPSAFTDGVVITNVAPNSSAANAGLQPKDIIISIDGNKMKNSADLRKYLYTEVEIGDQIKLEIYRGGEKISVELTLTSNS